MKQLSIPAKSAYRTKQAYVYHILRDAIMRCELTPGQKLVIRDIADQLSVSTIPVREALQQLHSEELVEYSPHVGTIVANISVSSIVETFTVKEGLETVATRTAVHRMTQEDWVTLENLVAEMDEALEKRVYEAWGERNAAFHREIAALADMPLLKEMSRRVMNRWDRIRRYFFSDVLVHRLIRSQEEHHAILRAIHERNSEAAEQLAKEHNQGALNDYMAHLEEKGKNHRQT